jgi:hypothetical protein
MANDMALLCQPHRVKKFCYSGATAMDGGSAVNAGAMFSESRNLDAFKPYWIPAFAGMTVEENTSLHYYRS